MENQPVILLAEDEENIREAIKLNLELEGYRVSVAENGQSALELSATFQFDLIILDVMMPVINGLDVCKKLRSSGVTVPVLFLTAKSDSSDRVAGLKVGDDYLTKPFDLEELLLRVGKLIKRNSGIIEPPTPESFAFYTYSINFLTYEILEGSRKKADLTKREALLLKLLIEKKGQVVAREEILDRIWGEESYPSSRTIDNYILTFRKLFEPDPRNPRFFHSIRGIGYKFTP